MYGETDTVSASPVSAASTQGLRSLKAHAPISRVLVFPVSARAPPFPTKGGPPHSALSFPFSLNRKKQRSSGPFSAGSSSVTSAQCPRVLPSPRPLVFLVCFTQEEQCPSSAVSCLVSFGTLSSRTLLPTTPSLWQRLMQKNAAKSLKSFHLLRLWGRSRRSAPFLPAVSDELTKMWRATYSASSGSHHRWWCWRKGIQQAPPFGGSSCCSSLPTICLSPAFTPCRTTAALTNRAYAAAGQAGSALHTMAVLQLFQAKLLCGMDESGQVYQEALKELRTATDLALHIMKAIAQAIGKTMARVPPLVKPHWDQGRWENGFPGLLARPAVDGFAERFSEAKKTLQALCHFLPKHPGPAAVGRKKNLATQPEKPA